MDNQRSLEDYQQQMRAELGKTIEQERRTLDWAIPDRTTKKGLAARQDYLRRQRARLENLSHIGSTRKQSAFHLICLVIAIFVGLRVTNAMIEHPLVAHSLLWVMIGLCIAAFFQATRTALSGLSRVPGFGWTAQSVDLSMAEEPRIRIPHESVWRIAWLKPVIGQTAASFRLPYLRRHRRLLTVRVIDLHLSSIEHLQAVEILRQRDQDAR